MNNESKYVRILAGALLVSCSFLISGCGDGNSQQQVDAHAHTNPYVIRRTGDATFTLSTSQVISKLTYPGDGAASVDGSQPFQWTVVSGSDAYFLYLGTSPGATDIYSSGEVQTTSISIPNLPVETIIYARLWTKYKGIWYSSDSSFQFATAFFPKAILTYPQDGAASVDGSQPFQWTLVVNAQAYYLHLGTSIGAKDLYNSGEVQMTSMVVENLPVGQTIYARMWIKYGGTWSSSDSSFTLASTKGVVFTPISRLTYPVNGATVVDRTQPFTWTTVSGAQAYYLYLGSTPGAKDIYNSGEVQTTSMVIENLPVGQTIYARMWTMYNGLWYYSDSHMYVLDKQNLPKSEFIYPKDGATDVDGSEPFQWTVSPDAQAYKLYVGTSLGAEDILNSGELYMNGLIQLFRFVDSLPVNIPLYARLWTRANNEWRYTDISFTVVQNQISIQKKIEKALWATVQVRNMADQQGRPYAGTELSKVNSAYANCFFYATALNNILPSMNVGTSKILNIAFNTNGDGHSLVEYFNEDQKSWMLLDPTFNLTMKRTVGGQWASAEDVSTTTRNQTWNDISYINLDTPVAASYYLDYPLLYLNVYHESDSLLIGEGVSPLPYLEEVSLPLNSQTYDNYILRNDVGGNDSMFIDGENISVSFNGQDFLSKTYTAQTIAVPTDSLANIRLYKPKWYVFR